MFMQEGFNEREAVMTAITPITVVGHGNTGIVPPWLNPTATPAPMLWDPVNPIVPGPGDDAWIMATPMLWDPVNPVVPEPGHDFVIMER